MRTVGSGSDRAGDPGRDGISRVAEVAARCRATHDHAERAALLARLADELRSQARAGTDPAVADTLSRQAAEADRQAGRERDALARAAGWEEP